MSLVVSSLSESSGRIPNRKVGAKPKNEWNSAIEDIRKGIPVKSLLPSRANWVCPIKAGMAVATSTTELGKAFFSMI